VAQRFAAYQDRIDSYLKMGIVPRSAAQTVMVKKYTVKPHFRRNSRHMASDNALHDAVEAYINNLLRRRTGDAPEENESATR
jgi:hypothetical protein